jgi:trimeric autotransporter adhesin
MMRRSAAVRAFLFLALAAACSDSTGPRTAPVPVLTSVSPNAATVGDATMTITVTGKDFRRESIVYWNHFALATTYVGSRELRAVVPAERLLTGGRGGVSVVTPEPGGGISAEQPVTVNHRAPTLGSLSLDSASIGNAVAPVIVTGAGFDDSTRVLWNGAEVPTQFRGPTEVSFQPPMTLAGVAAVAIRNPTPGGGTSAEKPFTVLNPVPVITLLPVQGGSAGRPGFNLTLHGTGFVPSSAVRWNGQRRVTTYISPTRLQISLSAAEVAAPGEAALDVVNDGPLVRTSGTAAFTLRTPGAATFTVQRIPFPANDLAWDAHSGRLYVSVRNTAAARRNTVTAYDPASGTVAGSVVVGEEPYRMAISGDGQYLYVGLNGEFAVRRVELPSLTAGLTWQLASGRIADDIAVMPGQPRTVAISIHDPLTSPSLKGVAIYDDGVARPATSPGHTGADRIEFLGSPSTLYGFDRSGSGWPFYTMSVDAAGTRHTHEQGGLLSGYYTDIVGASERIYGFDGGVVDAERRVRLGGFSVDFEHFPYGMAVDAATGRVFMLTERGIGVYDMNTYQLLGTIPVSGHRFRHPYALASPLVRWGTDGLAFLDEDELFILRSPVVGA